MSSPFISHTAGKTTVLQPKSVISHQSTLFYPQVIPATFKNWNALYLKTSSNRIDIVIFILPHYKMPLLQHS